jgi:signal transduction histidine kinase
MPTESRGKRQRSIRVLLTLIFIVPLASLLGLWGFAASVTVSNAIQEHNFNSENRMYGGWAQELFTQLAEERLMAYEWLSSGGQSPGEASLLAQQRATDVAAQAFTKGMYANSSRFVSSAWPAIRNFNKQLALLTGSGGIREQVDARNISALTAFSGYNAVIDASFSLYGQLIVVKDTPLYIQAAASVLAGRSVEMASREVTLVTGVFFSGDKMSQAQRILFAQIAASRQLLMTDALRELNASCGSGYRSAEASASYRRFTAIENHVIGSIGRKGSPPISLLTLAATVPLFTGYQAAEKQDRNALSSLGTQVGDQLLEQVALAGGAGLVAVALSIVLMVGFGRRISRELTGLQQAALELAHDRLPRVVRRLSQGEDVDVAAEAAPITGGRIAETARVAEAFSSVQRTAVEAAVGQARLRRGVSQVFRNLAWRSQSLLHRQLTLLDSMERKQTEPETLDELFQLDHLTTRMRRHAEGLVILSGAAPSRGWREPVPVVDVVRGAIAEVEEYKRVTVLCRAHDAIVGTAVADVIHLLAELVENATAYSPDSTAVTVRAERVANGFVAEIEDRGIGIAAEKLAAFNERLANPPEFDLADSNQLGLFVVARLASKHQIAVTLRRSPYGGTAAIVLMPHSIVVTREEEAPEAFDLVPEIAGNGRSIAAPSGSLPGEAQGAGIAESGSVVGSVADTGGGIGQNRWLAIPAEQSPTLPMGGQAQYLPAERAQDPAVTSPGIGAGDVVVVDSSPPVGEASPPIIGENGAGSDFGLGPLSGDRVPYDPRSRSTVDQPGEGGGMAFGWDPASGGASTYGRHEAPPALDGNARESAWEADTGTPGWDLGHSEFASPPSTARPALPRRHRQASLAPQLTNDDQASDDGYADSQHDVSPAGTRALVESLQYGFDRARTAAMPADDSGPAQGTIESPGTGEDARDL